MSRKNEHLIKSIEKIGETITMILVEMAGVKETLENLEEKVDSISKSSVDHETRITKLESTWRTIVFILAPFLTALAAIVVGLVFHK